MSHLVLRLYYNISLVILLGIASVSRSQSTASTPTTTATQWPILDNGLETTVQWDHYSLILNSKRLFDFGGEFHPFRIPVPEMWTDILEKIKASGMNSVSYYNHWGLQAPNASTIDFTTGAHNFERFYDLAKEVGLFVTARPGPYINGELSGGGIPLWAATGAYGELSNNNSAYTAAWMPYMSKMAEITREHQVTRNGTVLLWQVENEYPNQWSNVAAKTPRETSIAYYESLEKNARENGVEVPFIANAPSTSGKSWSVDYDTVDAGGDVDIYGLDSYPSCWSCVPSDCSTSNPSFTLLDYYSHFQQVSPRQPPTIPEFQGGALNPWNGPAEGCVNKSDVDFMNLYLRDNIAQKISILSLYMIYGGTNWGWLAVPFVPTTYDYSAAIAEDRSLRDKYYEIKLLGLFTRVASELPGTGRIGSGTNYTDNAAAFTTELYNANTSARFYVVRHDDPTDGTSEGFQLNVSTSLGNYSIPRKGAKIALDGYISKIVPTDFHFGGETLVYSTAEVLTYAVFDGRPTIAFWVPGGEAGELYFRGAKNGSVVSCNGCSSMGFYPNDDGLVVTFRQGKGRSIVQLSNGIRVLLMDRTTAYGFWVPGLTHDSLVPVEDVAFVLGPYLVRSAKFQGTTLDIRGDSNQTTAIEVFATTKATSILWNGRALATTKTAYGTLKASIPRPKTFAIPTFGTWKAHDSLPEKSLHYSDAGIAWVDANHTTTPNSLKTSTVPYLYIDDYGFYTGIHLWRGYFNGSSNATGVYLNVQGGIAFGYSVFLNGDLLGSFYGDVDSAAGALTLDFANATLRSDRNVLLVIQDNSGHDETSGVVTPRGILNATLLGSPPAPAFTHWKVAGTAGGASSRTLDPVRTYYNEGGLTGERLGWHLPGFDDSSWDTSSPSEGFSSAGIMFYRTTLALDVPDGHDVTFTFRFSPSKQSAEGAGPFRVLLYVNGYQYGRFNPHIRETNPYPVPPGILDYMGENTIAVAVWAQTVEGVAVEVAVEVAYVVESGLDVKFDGGYLRPGWSAERLEYV